jgi:hypothetical protein
MAFADLTAEQQGIVAEYTRLMRATVGEFARLLNHMAALDSMYDGQVAAAWAALDAGDIIAGKPVARRGKSFIEFDESGGGGHGADLQGAGAVR